MFRFGIRITGFTWLLAAGWLATTTPYAHPAEERTQPAPAPKPPVVQIIRAAEWIGAVEAGDEGCLASHGEYNVWVYASMTQCGVPRQQADRVVVIRQPLPGVAPIRATTQVPGGEYVVWVYGAGDPGHPGLRLCGKTCALGLLSTKPGWASLGWIELRDNQLLLLRTWEQPEGHRLHIQAVVLSSSETQPDWVP